MLPFHFTRYPHTVRRAHPAPYIMDLAPHMQHQCARPGYHHPRRGAPTPYHQPPAPPQRPSPTPDTRLPAHPMPLLLPLFWVLTLLGIEQRAGVGCWVHTATPSCNSHTPPPPTSRGRVGDVPAAVPTSSDAGAHAWPHRHLSVKLLRYLPVPVTPLWLRWWRRKLLLPSSLRCRTCTPRLPRHSSVA